MTNRQIDDIIESLGDGIIEKFGASTEEVLQEFDDAFPEIAEDLEDLERKFPWNIICIISQMNYSTPWQDSNKKYTY